jgi:hypothetical protein
MKAAAAAAATTIHGTATDETDVSVKAAAISTDAKAGSIADETNTEAAEAAVDGTNVDRDTTIATTETSRANLEADLVEATAGTTPTKEEEDVEVLIADETNTEEEAVDGTNVDRDTTIATTETSGANLEADLVEATAGTTPTKEEEDVEVLIADETNTEEEAVDGTNVDRGTTIVTTETSGENSEAGLIEAMMDAPRFATGMDLAKAIAALAIGSTTHPVVNAAVNVHRTITRDSVVRVENLVDPLMIAAIPISIAIATTKVSVADLTIPLDDAIPLVVLGAAVSGTTAGIPIGNRHPAMTFACGETRIVVGIKTFHDA